MMFSFHVTRSSARSTSRMVRASVSCGQPLERLELAHPDRVAPRVRVLARAHLDRPVHGAADPLGPRARARHDVGERQQVGRRRAVGERLVAALHLRAPRRSNRYVSPSADERLGVEVVLVGEPARVSPRDVAVVADRDQRHARRGDAAHVVAGRVHLELDEQLGDRVAELRPVEHERAARRRFLRTANMYEPPTRPISPSATFAARRGRVPSRRQLPPARDLERPRERRAAPA